MSGSASSQSVRKVLIGFAALGLVAQRDVSAGLAELKLFPFGMAETPTR
jgi:hypothetical protein